MPDRACSSLPRPVSAQCDTNACEPKDWGKTCERGDTKPECAGCSWCQGPPSPPAPPIAPNGCKWTYEGCYEQQWPSGRPVPHCCVLATDGCYLRTGRNLPVAPGRPPTLLPGAPGWHDGLTSNPLPPQDLPSSSFALPPDALSFLAAATSDHAEADRGGGGSGGGRASGDGGGGGSCRSARPGGSQSAGVRGRAGGAVRGSASSPNLIERLSRQPPTAGEVEGGYADAGAATAHSPTDQPIAQSLVSTMPHGFRHSRGRTRERAVLAPSTGVPGANGGLLGRQMAARLGVSGELPGPGAYPLSKGGGPIGARALPRSGLPRQRPFYAAHLKALGGLPQETGPS